MTQLELLFSIMLLSNVWDLFGRLIILIGG